MNGARKAELGDLRAMRALWTRSFPGDEAFCDWFLANAFAPEDGYVWRESEPVAMLHALPCDCAIGGRHVRGRYIYAVCTLPEWRGRGIAGALLAHALNDLRARGAELAWLAPQSESLFGYYRRLGFETAFFRHRFTAAPAPDAANVQIDEHPDPSELNALYERALGGRDHALRTPLHWTRVAETSRAFAARIDGRAVGYAVCDDGRISELVADGEARDALINAALPRLRLPSAPAFTPLAIGERVPFGMAQALVPEVALPANGYASLMFD